MPPQPRVVAAPDGGIWRVTKAKYGLEAPPASRMKDFSDSRAGNRWDSVMGIFSCLYFATEQEGCFGETLARLRPDPELKKLVSEEWSRLNFMDPGSIPRDWRTQRLAIRAEVVGGRHPGGHFLDVYNAETAAWLRSEMLPVALLLGHEDIDVATLQGPDRRLTRLVADKVAELRDGDGNYAYDGIRYASRLNPEWECWSVFGDVDLEEVERHPVHVNNPALRSVAQMFDLIIH